MQIFTTLLLWLSVLGCGLMAGVYFSFSTFVVAALARIPAAAGIAAMVSINRVILRSPFMPVFFGSTLSAAMLAVLAIVHWGAPGSPALLLGGCGYVLTMFVCTMLCNVPLNQELDRVDPSAATAEHTWRRFVQVWNRWNHVRTLGSTAAMAAFVYALAVRG